MKNLTQWIGKFSKRMTDEVEPSLGRNKVLRLGACMHNRLLATLYAVVAQLVEYEFSKLGVAGSCPVYGSMLMGVCNFNHANPVIKTSGSDAYDRALCKGLIEGLEVQKSGKKYDSLGVVHSSASLSNHKPATRLSGATLKQGIGSTSVPLWSLI